VVLLVQLRSPDARWIDVGHLCHTRGWSWFETLPSYWATAPRPVLGHIFEARNPTWRPSQRVTLPVWFSHLLPEGQLRRAVASAAGVNPEREFLLLARTGADDLPGAIRVRPDSAADAGDRQALLKFSLAGVQLKFSVRSQAERELTIPAKGQAGDWIVKLADERPDYQGVPEAEFAALELARAAGIAVPEAFLTDVKDIAGLPDWATAPGGRAFGRAPL